MLEQVEGIDFGKKDNSFPEWVKKYLPFLLTGGYQLEALLLDDEKISIRDDSYVINGKQMYSVMANMQIALLYKLYKAGLLLDKKPNKYYDKKPIVKKFDEDINKSEILRKLLSSILNDNEEAMSLIEIIERVKENVDFVGYSNIEIYRLIDFILVKGMNQMPPLWIRLSKGFYKR